MQVLEIGGFSAEASAMASEAFSRSWQFIQGDPVLAGHDRETLQAQLALGIQEIMRGDALEWSALRIANRAIVKIREEMRASDSRRLHP